VVGYASTTLNHYGSLFIACVPRGSRRGGLLNLIQTNRLDWMDERHLLHNTYLYTHVLYIIIKSSTTTTYPEMSQPTHHLLLIPSSCPKQKK